MALLFGFTAMQAQESINSTGGDSSNPTGSASYSIGQVVYTSNTAATGSVTQGVQQSFEISVVTSTEDAKNINLIVSAYPNPTTDFLTLKVENFSFDALSYQLYDSKGSLLENNKLKETETSIIMSKFMPNTYFLKGTQENKKIKTFKIIKK